MSLPVLIPLPVVDPSPILLGRFVNSPLCDSTLPTTEDPMSRCSRRSARPMRELYSSSKGMPILPCRPAASRRKEVSPQLATGHCVDGSFHGLFLASDGRRSGANRGVLPLPTNAAQHGSGSPRIPSGRLPRESYVSVCARWVVAPVLFCLLREVSTGFANEKSRLYRAQCWSRGVCTRTVA